MNEDSSDARNSAARAISSGRPSRPMGMCTSRRWRRSGSASSSASRGVSMGPGTDGVGPDAPAGVLHGQLAGEGQHAALRRRVGHLRGGRAHQGHERGHVHDRTAAGVEHGRDRGPAAQPHALQVHVHDLLPGRRGGVEDPAVVVGEDPGVVEQDVQAAVGADRGRRPWPPPGPRRRRRRHRRWPRPRRPRSRPRARLGLSATTSATTTSAPSAAKSAAATRPMPLPAPVITATLPVQSCHLGRPLGPRSPVRWSAAESVRTWSRVHADPWPRTLPGRSRWRWDTGRHGYRRSPAPRRGHHLPPDHVVGVVGPGRRPGAGTVPRHGRRRGGEAVLLPPPGVAASTPTDAARDHGWSRPSTAWCSSAAGTSTPPATERTPTRATAASAPERDDHEFGAARRRPGRRPPVLAICRGMQVLNVSLGGDLFQHLPDRLGPRRHQPRPGCFGR